MHKFNSIFIFIVFFILLGCSNTDKYKEMDKKGNALFDKQDYNGAFKLYKTACQDGNIISSCISLAVCYNNGLGTSQDTKKAYNILDNLLKNNDDLSQLAAAQLLEYVFPQENNLNKAYDIYSKLANSKNKEIKDIANNSLIIRLPIYQFLSEVLNIMNLYKNKKINFEKYNAMLNNINTNNINADTRNSFFEFRKSCLANEKQLDGLLGTIITNTGSVFVESFAAGIPGFISGMIGTGKMIYDHINVDKACKNRTEQFFKILEREGISNAWIGERR